MYSTLFSIPIWLALLLGGALAGPSLLPGKLRGSGRAVAAAAAGALLGLLLSFRPDWRGQYLPIHGYGVLILIGFLFGVWLAQRRSHLIGLTPARVMDAGLWGILGGLIGARLFHVIENWNEYSPFGEHGPAALLQIFALWNGGLVFFGAFAGCILAVAIYCRRHRIPILPFLDLASPGLIAGQALGRIGCLLHGCCYGKSCDLPWAIHFPPGSPAYLDQLGKDHPFPETGPLHPTQIYAVIGAALIASFLYAYWPRRNFDGQILALMMLMAGSMRFLEEFLRADNPVAFPGLSPVLTIAQWFGLGLVAAGILAWFYFRRGTRTGIA